MASLKDISMSDLAKAATTKLNLAKAGGQKDKGDFVDPFTLDIPFAVEITGEEIATHKTKGTMQVALKLSIIQDDGSLKKAGNVWIDLPVVPTTTDASGKVVSIFTNAEDEATYLQKAGERFLRFLRAVDPQRFSVFSSIDKGSGTDWTYLDFTGNVMSQKARNKRADEINGAVMAVAEGLVAVTVSLVGSQAVLTKKANPNSPKYPYSNFSALQS